MDLFLFHFEFLTPLYALKQEKILQCVLLPLVLLILNSEVNHLPLNIIVLAKVVGL